MTRKRVGPSGGMQKRAGEEEASSCIKVSSEGRGSRDSGKSGEKVGTKRTGKGMKAANREGCVCVCDVWKK